MKSDVIEVSSRDDRIEDALKLTERVAAYNELSPKNVLHLRLLAEETMCLVRAITEDLRGQFWIVNNKDNYELHLTARTSVDPLQREKLLSASFSGKNEAHRGFIGKIRAFFEPMEGVYVPLAAVPGDVDADLTWSMSTYQLQVQQAMEQKQDGATEAWDELEKSVLAHLADDVKVSINGFDVEMIVYKKLS